MVVVPSRCCHPFFVSGGRVHTSSIGSSDLLVEGGCALVLLVVLIFDSGLSSPGLLCGSAMSLRFVALLFGGCPPTVCLATGLVALFPYFALQLALGMQVPVGSFLPYGSHPSRWSHPCGVEAGEVLDRNEGLLSSSFHFGLLLRYAVTLWVKTVFDLILDRNEDFSAYLFGWFRTFVVTSPFWGSRLRCGLLPLFA